MRILFCVFLLLATPLCATENKGGVNTFPLAGFQKFEVVTLFSPCDKIEKDQVYLSEEQAFKQLGQVTSSSGESMLVSLVQDAFSLVQQEVLKSPICFFSIERKEDDFEVSMEVSVEVEVVANKYKTACPVWKKTVYSPIEGGIQDNVDLNQSIQELVKAFAEDWKKANSQSSKQPSFHIRKYKEL